MQYLAKTPSLSSHRPREDLMKYTSTSNVHIKAVLVREGDKRHSTKYFVRHFMIEP